MEEYFWFVCTVSYTKEKRTSMKVLIKATTYTEAEKKCAEYLTLDDKHKSCVYLVQADDLNGAEDKTQEQLNGSSWEYVSVALSPIVEVIE